MLVPRRLKVKGFRGFRAEVEFHFDRPATMLFGENRSCKSSTLNAIEWCLFGDDCLGRQTGIRERIGWIVANRDMGPADARVELELTNGAGSCRLQRCQRKVGKKTVEELQLVLADGELLEGHAAEQALHRLLGSSFRDFLSIAYQHQEAIRAVLTQEPKERNDAIDRLLGLSIYRNLLDPLAKVKAADRQKLMRERFEGFERQVRTALATRENDLAELRQEAAEAGVPLNKQKEGTILAGAKTVKRSLVAFAQEMGLSLPAVEAGGMWQDWPAFQVAAKRATAFLRSNMPGVQEQQELFRRQLRLVNVKTELEHARASSAALRQTTSELALEFGSQQTLTTRLAAVKEAIAEEQARLRQTNGQAALISEGIAYLETAAVGGTKDSCPLCGAPAPELLTSLRKLWSETLQAAVATIQAKIQDLTEQRAKLEAGFARYQALTEQLQKVVQALDRCHQDIGNQLGRLLQPEDDPMALLVAELQVIEERGRKLQELLQTKQERLAELERELDKHQLVYGVLQKEEKKKSLEAIQASAAFKALEAVRDQVAECVIDIEAIQEAVAEVAHDEAQEKLLTAERVIDFYFRELTCHPGVRGIKLHLEESRNQRNAYEITDQDGRDLTPVLSQGDLNALALAIFLGLAATSGNSGAYGFVMLDDPSQSLGSEHKKRLVKVLNDIAQYKSLLVATMDGELRSLLQDGLTKAKAEYAFGKWTPENGPSIIRN
jgi:DNA repair protein SbcC/Rad50